ncbi:MerR family transcriptional regulator [Saccharopolyspora oryzae]|uniref:MerR family transcriptional regulator n=1 Tax=Saccharopolyspora oryzae TaxID=2997343 RepID=A0ABT4V2R1_9PSEU|nr:MerR family transcriptional regulator [Saccharopolyspora oryzae]MDA3628252.1 MerR family transcriptional regulator [Saccharopolyspora oryzae]
MTGTGGAKRPLRSVGALAEATGLTVRTLHHYDELGLLRAGERTASGHRRYTEQDLQRLYQIRLLRELGMSLEEIGDVLADPAALREVLVGHLGQLDEQASRLDALRNRTRSLLEQLDESRRPETGELLAALGRMSTIDQHITDEQRAVLAERAEALGPEGREMLDSEWPLVAAKLVRHCQADDPVDDPDVQRSARRLFELVDVFTGGDPEILSSMLQFLRERAVPERQDFVLGEDLPDYLDRVAESLS